MGLSRDSFVTKARVKGGVNKIPNVARAEQKGHATKSQY